MAFLQANVFSNVLEMEVMLDIILPQETKKTFGTNTKGTSEDVPVLYLLHGMNGNHSVWQRRTAIERYVANMGLAVIMPSTDLAWYTDTRYDMNYWTFIAEELSEICHELFPQLTTKRAKTFAAGLSMGGYGAVKLGLRKPENFAAIASLSGGLTIAEGMDQLLEIKGRSYWEGIFGPLAEIKGSENDLIHLIKNLEAAQAPKFFITCGTEDPLHQSSTYTVEKMQEQGYDVSFEDGPGEHDWIYWDHWIQRILDWLPL
ncbi:MAG: esterase family protein [Tetragenococcus halophilus]|uniref:alpha/beta hydrolase n=1 Tax=Tetragenococcus halophilus TaxID=51669 RepID=UPI001F43FDE0|nr:alpha/beta hydrolase family protein [Tetragenococcus halophilus]MCF1676412.1 esterase family protein [Tetragenococcus halophilus]MDN6142513.1 esterase family protein [Tetragenococcus halophilus]MDN6142915.1 esterase family protein [Tetragenococcus halophilus]MDN6154136.1 esterase family protein [Tetragenococcus halophilus]MDN6258055.1 esterase family protein [Tetragenococcus halophilus]